MGEFEKRIKQKVDSGLDAVNETVWKQFLTIVGQAETEFRGFEKEILHLLEQKRHPESEKALKYAYQTLQSLNDKWFGEIKEEVLS